MKKSRSTTRILTASIATVLTSLLLLAETAHAANGSWNVDGSANWSVGPWNPVAVPGITAGDVVNLQFNITAARTITIDTTSRSVGDLNIGDPTATVFAYTLAASGGASLNLDGTGAADATVDFTAAAANAISAPIILVDNGVFRSNVANVQTLSGIISGVGKTLTFNNDTNATVNAAVALQGQFTLSGGNTYTGGTSISDVRVTAGVAAALGTGAVNIAAGGQVFASTAITLANAFNINGNGWLETAAGQPFGALRLDSGAIVSGAVTMQSNSAIGNNTGIGTVSGVISGTGFGLTKVGAAASTLVLSNANTYDGGTTILAGVLQLNNATAAGTGTTIALANSGSGRLRINGGLTVGYNVTIGTAQVGAVNEGLIQSVGTGQATMNGTITVNGLSTNGGTFYGGLAAGNELVLNGAINGASTLGMSQRDGRVIYKGGGSIGGTFTITGTAFVGATNGLPTLLVPFLGGSGNATLDLSGFSQEFGGLTRNANTTSVTTTSGAPVLTLNVAGTNSFTYTGGVAGGLSLVKTGTGTQKLSGTGTFTGGTTVNNGTLIGTTTSALGTNSGLTLAAGNFSYQPTAAGALNVGTGVLNLAGGTTIGTALAGTASQSAITSTGAATTAGAVTVDVWMIPGVAPTAGANNLITAASGLDTAAYTLGKVFNATDATISGLATSPTAVSINVTAATPLTTAYWRGGLAGSTNVWAVSDGSTQSNWVATLGGAIQPLVPGSGADVIVSDSTVTTTPAPSTLGAGMSVKSLTIADTTNGLTLNADGFSLTTGTGGITMAASVPASTIAAPVALGAAQTWTNNSANALTVSGVVSGANALTKAGNGTLLLSGANTNTGGVNLDAGTLSLGSTTALGAIGGNFTITGGTLDTTVSMTMGNAKPTVINGDFAFAGTGNLNLSTGAVSLGTTAGTTRTITVNASTLTLGGIVSNGTTANSVTKGGAGTLVLSGVNTYSGVTSVTGGILQIGLTTNLGDGLAANTIALSGNGAIVATASTDLGANRSVAVAPGGGRLCLSNTAAVTLTVSGNVSGSDPLTFRNLSSGAATYTLSGVNNSGYTGAITVEAGSTGVSTLNIATAAALPAASSITLNFPAASVTTGAATTLTLQNGITLPASTTLNFTSSLPTAAISLRSGLALNGTDVINSPITLSGDSIIQFGGAAASATTYSNNITEAAPGAFTQSGLQAFSNVLFFRGTTTSTHTVNSTITLPSAGATVAVTDGATLLLNSSGNSFASAAPLFGTIRLGATNAIPTTARLLIGQTGNQVATLDLNGFDQTVTGLEWAATSAALTKGISNSNATTTSTFTVIQAVAPLATVFNGAISGKVNFVKQGAATVTLGTALSDFTGNVTVNDGTLVAAAVSAAAGTTGTLGVANLAGKTVTVNSPGILSFTSNNIFGNGVGNANLPAVFVNGTTLTSTRYNVLGDLTLNGGTLTQASTDVTNFEGYQFRGSVTVGGSAVSTIATTNGKANHLNANTVFTVANATLGTDLLVSAPLRNQSNDFALATGALTKEGAGTMELTAANVFTGGVTINAGTLNVNADAALGATAGAVAINNNAVLQASGTVTTAARTVTLGTGGGTIDTNGQRVNLNVGSTVTGTTLTKVGAGVLTLAGTQTYAALNVSVGDVNLDSPLGTGTSTVNVDGRMNISVSQTLASLTIGNGAIVSIGGTAYAPPAPADGGLGGGDLAGVPVQGVPEPGSATLLLGGMLTLLGLRRRR